MSIYAYLKQDHKKVKELMSEIVALGDADSPKRDELFNELKTSLILHSKAEEKAFYEPLRKFKETKEEVEHGKEEHQEVEQLLKELTDESLKGAAWLQKFRTLQKAVEHHIEEEETEIFTDAKKVVDAHKEEEMEATMKMLKEEERQSREIKKRDAA